MTTHHVTLPENKQRRRELYCLMLDLPKNCKLTVDELEEIGISRGYLKRNKEVSK